MELDQFTAPPGLFQFEHTQCCLCRVDDSSVLHTFDNYDQGLITFVQCNRCGHVYQNPRPTAASLNNLFSTQEFLSAKETGIDFEKFIGYWDYFADELPRQKMAASRLRHIHKLTGNRPLNILKVGCGPGTLLALAREQGHTVTGVDASEYFCRYGKHKYGLDLINSSFEDVELPEKQYDVVLILGVLQHFTDPRACLEKAMRLVKDDGYILVNYFTFDSLLVRILGKHHVLFRPQILNIFPKKVFRQLLNECGFQILSSAVDVQYATIAKLLFFSKIPFIWKMLKILPLERLAIKLPVPGGFMLTCRKA